MANTKIIVRLHQIFFIIKSIIYIIDMLAPKNAAISSLCSDLWWDGNWPTRNKGPTETDAESVSSKKHMFWLVQPYPWEFSRFPRFFCVCFDGPNQFVQHVLMVLSNFPKLFHILSHVFIISGAQKATTAHSCPCLGLPSWSWPEPLPPVLLWPRNRRNTWQMSWLGKMLMSGVRDDSKKKNNNNTNKQTNKQTKKQNKTKQTNKQNQTNK